jgi:hypothetical protein
MDSPTSQAQSYQEILCDHLVLLISVAQVSRRRFLLSELRGPTGAIKCFMLAFRLARLANMLQILTLRDDGLLESIPTCFRWCNKTLASVSAGILRSGNPSSMRSVRIVMANKQLDR